MVTATARNPVQDRQVKATAETLTKTFEAEVMGTAEPGIEMKTTIGVAGASGPVGATGEAPSTAVTTTATSGQLPSTRFADETGAISGEFDESDLKFPTLSIVQGSSGALAARFLTGTLVFGEEALFDPPKPSEKSAVLRFVPVGLNKSYRERVSQEQYQAGEMPRFARTRAEVMELGGSLGFGPDGERPTWEPSCKCVFLIEAPAGTEHPGFGIDIDGKLYAVGVYYAKGMGYGFTAKMLFNCWNTVLFVNKLDAEGKPVFVPGTQRPLKTKYLSKRFWNWTWGTRKVGQNNPWYPTISLTTEDTSPAIRQFIDENLAPHSTIQGEE